jgi:hypothetical protein
MRIVNPLKRFRQYLGRGRQGPRPAKLRSQPRVEKREARMLLSTLNINLFSQAVYTGGITYALQGPREEEIEGHDANRRKALVDAYECSDPVQLKLRS